MKKFDFKLVAVSGLLALSGLGGTVYAASTWDLNAGCVSGGNGTALTTGSCGAGSGSGSTTTLSAAGIATTATGDKFASAAIWDWGTWGLGVVNSLENAGDTGPHAADNYNKTDAFLFSFNKAVNLTGLKIGWNGTDNPTDSSADAGTNIDSAVDYRDSDISVLAWKGTGAPTPIASGGQTVTQLLAAGWSLVANYADVGVNANNAQAINAVNGNGSAVYSSYWLVSAYNSLYGGTKTDAYGEVGGPVPNVQYVDAFKMLLLQADPCTGTVSANQCSTVPEPSVLWLLAVGTVALVATRRKKLGVAAFAA